MIEQYDQKLRERVNKAIVNIRYIASNAKRPKRQDAIQKGEDVVTILDLFRKYVAVNEGRAIPDDKACTFKHNKETFQAVDNAVLRAHEVYMLLTEPNRRKYKEEYRQVELLLSDLVTYLEAVLVTEPNHA